MHAGAPGSGWDPFWKAYSDVIRLRIRRYSIPREDAADLEQEVALRLVQDDFRLVRAWNPDRGSMRGYLYVIAGSVVKSHLRRAARRSRIEGIPLEEIDPSRRPSASSHHPSPREWSHQRELESKVILSLWVWMEGCCLSVTDRTLLTMHLDGRRFSEIAVALAMSDQCCLTRFSRLKSKLRKVLEKDQLQWTDAA